MKLSSYKGIETKGVTYLNNYKGFIYKKNHWRVYIQTTIISSWNFHKEFKKGFYLIWQDYLLWLQSSGRSTKMHVDELNSDDLTYSFVMDDLSSPSMFVFYDKNIQPHGNGNQ